MRDELTERFGKITAPVENLLLVTRIRIAAKNLGVKSIQENNLRVEIVFNDIKTITAQGLIELNGIFRRDFKFIESSQRIFITFRAKDKLLIQILNILKILSQ